MLVSSSSITYTEGRFGKKGSLSSLSCGLDLCMICSGLRENVKLYGPPGTPPSALAAIQGAELRKEAGETMQGDLEPQAEPAVATSR